METRERLAAYVAKAARDGLMLGDDGGQTVADLVLRFLEGRDVTGLDEQALRADERCRVAQLLEHHADTLASWPKDTKASIEMVCFLLRLPGSPGPRTPSPVQRAAAGPRQDAFPVWREFGRICNAAGVGYSDDVPDEQIIRHVQNDLGLRDFQSAAFGVAVLSLRQQERGAS